jgi:uncharacterized membrane protein YwaF
MIAFSLNSPLVFEHSFIGYSSEHFFILCFFCLSGLIYIRSLGKLNLEKQHRILFISAIVLALVQLSRIPILTINGQFNIETDLPLHLCNFLPFAMIWSYGVRSEKIWSVMFSGSCWDAVKLILLLLYASHYSTMMLYDIG